MLPTLTLIVSALIVLALAGYLIAIAVALTAAKRNVAQIANGLEAIGESTRPLPEYLGQVNGALGQLLKGLEGVDEHLAGVARLLKT